MGKNFDETDTVAVDDVLKYNNVKDQWDAQPGGLASVALNDLSDATITAPAAGEYLRKGAGDWVNAVIPVGDLPTGIPKTNISSTGTWANSEIAALPVLGTSPSPARQTVIVNSEISTVDTSKITTGTMATARLGSGTADSTTFLRGDQTYAVPVGGAGAPFVDTTSIAKGSVDATKEVRFEVDGNTTGIVGVIATAFTTAKTVTLPNADDTLMGKATTDTMTNKTIDADGTGNSITNIENADIKAGAAITYNKIQDVSATDRVLGRDTAGAGVIEEITPAALLTMLAAYSNMVIQVFTTPGANTYTPTSGMKHCLVISTGGGGGAGGADTDGTSGSIGGGGGGGAGGTCIERFTAADIGASQTVTIGAAGTAGGATGTSGGVGGNTTFGALHTANGGAPGSGPGTSTVDFTSTAGGGGGVPTGGLLNITGGDGMSAIGGGVDGTTDLSFCQGGHGGASFWGGGGKGGAAANATLTTDATQAGNAGKAYGSGGGGGANCNATAGVAGGAGVAGVCLIIEYT